MVERIFLILLLDELKHPGHARIVGYTVGIWG